jgi:hypothetical protein
MVLGGLFRSEALGETMLNFLKKYKGYLLHGVAAAAVFLTPSVQAFAAEHQAYAGAVVLAWGWVLHWANGKK